jgi:hypothetical protein
MVWPGMWLRQTTIEGNLLCFQQIPYPMNFVNLTKTLNLGAKDKEIKASLSVTTKNKIY